MKTTILSDRELQELVGRVGIDSLMDELIEKLTQAFASYDPRRMEIPVRTGFYYHQPAMGLIEWMPLFERHWRRLPRAGFSRGLWGERAISSAPPRTGRVGSGDDGRAGDGDSQGGHDCDDRHCDGLDAGHGCFLCQGRFEICVVDAHIVVRVRPTSCEALHRWVPIFAFRAFRGCFVAKWRGPSSICHENVMFSGGYAGRLPSVRGPFPNRRVR